MIIENPEALKSWLTAVLAPLCDEDPAVLAKNVLALAKKKNTESELRGAMYDQLIVFLHHETIGFIDKLFVTLETKSYLQSNPEPPSHTVESTTPTAATEQASTGVTNSPNLVIPSVHRDRTARRPRSRDRSTRDQREGCSTWDDRRQSPGRNRRFYQRRYRSRSPLPVRRSSRSTRGSRRNPSPIAPPPVVAALENVVVAPRLGLLPVPPAADPAIVVGNPFPLLNRFRCREYAARGHCTRGLICPFDHGDVPVDGGLWGLLFSNRPPHPEDGTDGATGAPPGPLPAASSSRANY